MLLLHQFNMEDCVRELLNKWQLSEYIAVFINNGFDDIDIIRQIDSNDLDAMGITCLKEKSKILHRISHINTMFTSYMDVEEVQRKPYNSEQVVSIIAEKAQKEGILPTGEEAVPLVAEVLQQEGIILSPHNLQSYQTKEGYISTRREYNVLRARIAQQLLLPNETVVDALKILHESALFNAPMKPPRPKIPPYLVSKGGIPIKDSTDNNYENINNLYHMIANIDINTIGSQESQKHYEDLIRFDTTPLPASTNSSPLPARQQKKKPTFFKRFKANLFGKSNTSLDSYLASSTKTLISDKSSECSNPKLSLGIFSKNKPKKDKNNQPAFERQRSYSAPEQVSNVKLCNIPEQQSSSNVFLCREEKFPSRIQSRPFHEEGCRGRKGSMCSTPHIVYPVPRHEVKSDTYSSGSSSDSTGDSAYSSKSCLHTRTSYSSNSSYGVGNSTNSCYGGGNSVNSSYGMGNSTSFNCGVKNPTNCSYPIQIPTSFTPSYPVHMPPPPTNSSYPINNSVINSSSHPVLSTNSNCSYPVSRSGYAVNNSNYGCLSVMSSAVMSYDLPLVSYPIYQNTQLPIAECQCYTCKTPMQ